MLMQLNDAQIRLLQAKFSDLVNYVSDDPLAPIDPETYVDSGGDTLLHIAVMRGDSESARLLLSCGADPNSRGDMGSTPLHYANAEGRPDLVNLLIQFGADKSLVNEFGQRAGDAG